MVVRAKTRRHGEHFKTKENITHHNITKQNSGSFHDSNFQSTLSLIVSIQNFNLHQFAKIPLPPLVPPCQPLPPGRLLFAFDSSSSLEIPNFPDEGLHPVKVKRRNPSGFLIPPPPKLLPLLLPLPPLVTLFLCILPLLLLLLSPPFQHFGHLSNFSRTFSLSTSPCSQFLPFMLPPLPSHLYRFLFFHQIPSLPLRFS